jgi:hypothetical protein
MENQSMTIRSLTLAVGSVTALVLAACGSSGSSGAGGSGGSALGGDGAGGDLDCAASCEAAITNGGMPCTSDSAGTEAYAKWETCADKSCPTECSDFQTMGQTADCSTCMTMKCASEATGCAGN